MSAAEYNVTTQQLLDGLNVASFYEAQIPGLRMNGVEDVKTKCPIHGGDGLSINIASGLWKCHSDRCLKGGSAWGFLEEKGFGPSQIRSTLMDFQRGGTITAKPKKAPLGPIIETYDYTDENGALLFQVTRHDPKNFRQRRRGPDGNWIDNIVGVRRVLYHLPRLIGAVEAGWTVYIVEGEKDADAINGIESGVEFFATCSPGGAGQWRPEFNDALKGAHVVVVADDDEPGRKHALDVRHHLRPVAASVEIVKAKTGKDAFDHIADGHGLGDFVAMPEPGETDDAPSSNDVSILGPAIDLYDPTIVGKKPDFDVTDLIRRSGLHLVWAQPSGGKTWTLLRLVHEMMSPPEAQQSKLTGHPGLLIKRRWKRVLWIATEEDASALRYKADQVKRGLDIDQLDGKLLYRFAADPKRRLTLDDLEEIIAVDGPLDAIVGDSLTGLRPKTVNGQSVKWDLDNDAANTMCLNLRGLIATHQIAMLLCHHTGRDVTKGYRGPTDWWASADVMFGLVPDAGRTKVSVEKNRDGKIIAPFYLTPSWDCDRYDLKYDGGAAEGNLPGSVKTVHTWFKGCGQASQAQAIAAGLGARSTVQAAIQTLIKLGRLRETGNYVNASPIYSVVPDGAREESGTLDGEK